MNKDIRTMTITTFRCLFCSLWTDFTRCCVSIVNFWTKKFHLLEFSIALEFLINRSSRNFSIFQSGFVVQASFGTDTKTIFRIFKKISGWFIFLNSYLHYIKYRNFILFPGDEIFRKRSAVRDNSLHLILVLEAATWKFFSMVAFAKGSCNISYFASKHFVTWRINLTHYMLNKFNTEFKELFFFIFFYWNLSQLLFKDFVKVYIVMESL